MTDRSLAHFSFKASGIISSSLAGDLRKSIVARVCLLAAFLYFSRMALARILVDGYSLLHSWPDLAPGQPRHSERARDELILILTQYHDVTGEPLTIFFDG